MPNINARPEYGDIKDIEDQEPSPSSDYFRIIRKEALDRIDLKIKNEQASDFPNASEIARLEAAKEKLNDDQYIVNFAKDKGWEKSRDTEDVDTALALELTNETLNSIPQTLH